MRQTYMNKQALEEAAVKIITEKKLFCEFNQTIKLFRPYSSFQQGAEFDFD